LLSSFPVHCQSTGSAQESTAALCRRVKTDVQESSMITGSELLRAEIERVCDIDRSEVIKLVEYQPKNSLP